MLMAASQPATQAKPRKPTSPMASPIGTPRNIRTSMAAKPMMPMMVASITLSPAAKRQRLGQ